MIHKIMLNVNAATIWDFNHDRKFGATVTFIKTEKCNPENA